MTTPARLLDAAEQPIVAKEARSFGGFMSKYWTIIMCGVGVIAGYAVTQERVGELQRRMTATEQTMGTMATKADLARVEAGVTFLVQREMTKGAK